MLLHKVLSIEVGIIIVVTPSLVSIMAMLSYMLVAMGRKVIMGRPARAVLVGVLGIMGNHRVRMLVRGLMPNHIWEIWWLTMCLAFIRSQAKGRTRIIMLWVGKILKVDRKNTVICLLEVDSKRKVLDECILGINKIRVIEGSRRAQTYQSYTTIGPINHKTWTSSYLTNAHHRSTGSYTHSATR